MVERGGRGGGELEEVFPVEPSEGRRAREGFAGVSTEEPEEGGRGGGAAPVGANGIKSPVELFRPWPGTSGVDNPLTLTARGGRI